ncbi:MAG TPA: LysR family transcriptional regulator, partial [Pararobbsia sp.]|nr:LysR family transcriptional regulator [Pararobbsia sp.]
MRANLVNSLRTISFFLLGSYSHTKAALDKWSTHVVAAIPRGQIDSARTAMRPHQLKALVAAADHGSIRAAARSVFLSQGALTKALKELEGEVDVALITRSTQGIQLTEAGRLLYVRASAIIAQMTAARDAVDRLKGESEGTLRAAISPLTAVTFFPRAYLAFRRRMPNVEVCLA